MKTNNLIVPPSIVTGLVHKISSGGLNGKLQDWLIYC